jgi:hypothetical protein
MFLTFQIKLISKYKLIICVLMNYNTDARDLVVRISNPAQVQMFS